jgi:transcriptional regulator with XRE-family HTH domain
MRSFGSILKTQRESLRLTQKQVASSVGVSDAYICSLESDKKIPPPYRTVLAIADAIQIDADQLWKIAVKNREKYALERSRIKTTSRKKNSVKTTNGDNPSTVDDIPETPDSEINAFFGLSNIEIIVYGLFKKLPKDMTKEEKRFVYHALNSAQKFVSGS